MKNAKDVVTPLIFANLQNLTIPEVDFSGGWLKNIDIHIDQPAITDVDILTVNADNGIELTGKNFAAKLTADFRYKVLFITATGQADITMSGIGIDMELGLGT